MKLSGKYIVCVYDSSSGPKPTCTVQLIHGVREAYEKIRPYIKVMRLTTVTLCDDDNKCYVKEITYTITKILWGDADAESWAEREIDITLEDGYESVEAIFKLLL